MRDPTGELTRRRSPSKSTRGLLAQTGTPGNLVGDAHLAALALEHDETVISFESDFIRFQGVRRSRPKGAF